MVRDTSLSAWREINENGLLTELNLLVYNFHREYHAKHGNHTGAELMHAAMLRWPGREPRYYHNFEKRLCDLRDRGVVAEDGTKICSISKRNCIAWTICDDLPKAKEKKKPKDEWIFELTMENIELKKRVEELERKLNALLA